MEQDQPIDYRLAGPADAAGIRDIVRDAYAPWVPAIGREPLPMTADYEEALTRHRFDLLVQGGQVLAVLETEARDGHLWIENIAVRPEAQGSGLGSRLLRRAEAIARGEGLAEIRLLTNAAFVSNIALYERRGFSVTGREPHGNGTTVHMARSIDLQASVN